MSAGACDGVARRPLATTAARADGPTIPRVTTLPPMGLDRRELLKAGALLVAAGLAGPRLLPAPGPAAAAAGLSSARGATYSALVGALRHAPDGGFGARGRERSVRAFGEWYARQGPEGRLHADAVLDGLSGVLRPGRDDRARYAALRDRPEGARPSSAEAARRATIVAALALASPDAPGEDRAALGALA